MNLVRRSRRSLAPRGARLGAAALLGALLLFASATSAPAAAPPVKAEVSVAVADGFARLAFRFAEEIESQVKLSNGVVVITFKRPVNISIDRLSSGASDYIGVARRDPDGTGIRIALSRKLKINTMAAGERLFVDLLPENWTGVLPGLPQEVVEDLERRARDAEKKAKQQVQIAQQRKQPPIRVRMGKQPTFTRYIFDLPDKVGVSHEKGPDKLTLVFDAPLKFDLADAVAALPPAVDSIQADLDTDSIAVRFAFASKVDLRTFREDNSYVVDVIPTAAKKPVNSPEAQSDPDEAADADEIVAEKEAPATGVDIPAAAPLPPAAKSASKAAEAPPPQQPREQWPQRAAEQPAEKRAPEPAAPPRMRSGAVVAEVLRQGENLRLTFPFDTPTPTAVFRRADTLWLLFDSDAEIDIAALNADVSRVIRSAVLTRAADGAVVRLKLERPRLASLTADGPVWTLTIGDSVVDPSKPLSMTRNIVGPNRASIIIPFDDPRQLHRLVDPEIGDTLFVVTGLGPPRGFLKPQDFVEFRALATTHGVVVQPLADDIATELSADKIVVGRPSGLTLSAASASSRAGSAPVVLDAQIWGFDRQADFTERQALLLRAAAEAPEGKRLAARRDLARFYIAREMEAEAKAVLDVALGKDRPSAEDVPTLVLRAIAEIMMGRNEEALKDLSNSVVGNQHDAPLWRALAQARQGKWGEAREGFKNVEVSMNTLPIELQRLSLKEATRASIEVRDFSGAANLLNDLEAIGIPPELQPAMSVLAGRLAEGLGRTDDALAAYRNAAGSQDRPAAAQGKLRETVLRSALGDLQPSEIISELEILTTTWRGDETEIEALQLLARLYTQEGRYRDAFYVMRTALRAHPDSEMTRRIQDEAAATFESLFLSTKGDSLPTIDALSLFYDFRELTPIGRRGNEMIRRLADRLVTVDLLDQAAELLQYQVDHRLQASARAQVATRLAVIYLMNRKPDRALATLRATRSADLSNELRNQRLLLESRALSDIGRHELALEVVANVESREALRLRSDILWAARRWSEAAEKIEILYGNRWQEWEPLNEVERADILRAAIGFALGEDSLGVGRFREKYAAKMAESPDRRAFDIVTAPSGASGAEFRNIVSSVAAVDTLNGFLRDMRTRYPETGGSAPALVVPAVQPAAAKLDAASTGAASPPRGANRQASAR
jgi:tetratricopeptide (TPR) repeat protein